MKSYKNLYTKHPNGGEIVLWCDGKGENKNRNNGTRQEREEDAFWLSTKTSLTILMIVPKHTS